MDLTVGILCWWTVVNVESTVSRPTYFKLCFLFQLKAGLSKLYVFGQGTSFLVKIIVSHVFLCFFLYLYFILPTGPFEKKILNVVTSFLEIRDQGDDSIN